MEPDLFISTISLQKYDTFYYWEITFFFMCSYNLDSWKTQKVILKFGNVVDFAYLRTQNDLLWLIGTINISRFMENP